MMDFSFDLQLFGGVLDLTAAKADITATTGTVYSALYITNDTPTWSVDSADAIVKVDLKTSVTGTANKVSFAANNVKSVTVYSEYGDGITLPSTTDYEITITDANSSGTVFTLGTGTFSCTSARTKGAYVTGTVAGFVPDAKVGLSNVSGSAILDKANTSGAATLTGVTANLAKTAVTEFTAGKINLTSTATTLTLMGADIAAVTGAYEAKTNSAGNAYIAATLSGTAKALALTSATVPFSVTGTSGADTLTTSGTKDDTISAGAGNDTITAAAGTGVVSINGGAGNDSIKSGINLGANSTILGGDGKDIVELTALATNVTTELLVDGGAGDDRINAVAADATKLTNSTILGGAGSDTIATNSDSVTITGGDGADYFDISVATNRANVSDYKFGEDYFYTGALLTNAATAANTLALAPATDLGSDGTSGYIKADLGKATVVSSNGYFAVSLQDADKNKVDLGWTGSDGATINGGSLTRAMVLTGQTNSEGDLLIGGSKADTLYAGENDSVYGGAGADDVQIDGNATGVYVGIATNSGKDTVTGFTTGFDIDAADAVYLVNGSSSDFGATYDGTDLVLKDGSASMTLLAAAAGNGGTDTTDLLVSGKKVVVAKNKATITTDDLSYADYWFGSYSSEDKTGSAADFSTATDAVNINLGDTDHIRYIYTLKGGSGNTTLMGGTAAESLVAASGSTTSLYGGAGKDTLVSSGDSVTEFFFMNGAGNDEIQGFTTGTDTDNSDVLNFFGSGLGSIVRTGGDVVKIKTSDGSTLTVNQATSSADEKIQWVSGDAKGVAKIATSSGSSLSYDTDVTTYLGSTKQDTLVVNSGDGSDVNIWLDGSQGVSYSAIDVVDASGRAGNTTVAGSAIAETITGGSGSASLWGGAGQVADVLKSATGSTTTFFYGLGNGSDSVSGSSGDTVNLFDINLSDVTAAEIKNSQVIFTTSANDTVTVSGAQTFQLADGSKWTANYSTNRWEAAQ